MIQKPMISVGQTVAEHRPQTQVRQKQRAHSQMDANTRNPGKAGKLPFAPIPIAQTPIDTDHLVKEIKKPAKNEEKKNVQEKLNIIKNITVREGVSY
jgi:hypothetical protein